MVRRRTIRASLPLAALTPALLMVILAAGCGLNRSRLATEQLVIADAVDHAVSQIDFSPLAGKRAFFDARYISTLKLAPNSNVEYVVSSLRQQMLAYNVHLVEKQEEAEIIVEPRLGALANDGSEITYGIPNNNTVRAAAAVTPFAAVVPPLPDLSFGRRNHQIGAARVGVFAYDRVTREPLWQSGVRTGASEARDLWVMGMGPFQDGRVYDQAKITTRAPSIFRRKKPDPPGLAQFTTAQTFRAPPQVAPVITPELVVQPPAANPQSQVAGQP